LLRIITRSSPRAFFYIISPISCIHTHHGKLTGFEFFQPSYLIIKQLVFQQSLVNLEHKKEQKNMREDLQSVTPHFFHLLRTMLHFVKFNSTILLPGNKTIITESEIRVSFPRVVFQQSLVNLEQKKEQKNMREDLQSVTPHFFTCYEQCFIL